MMYTKEIPGTTFFETDVDGIVTLKAEFAYEAHEFLWLRKGEDVGAEIIATFLALVNTLPSLDWAELVKDRPRFHTVKIGMEKNQPEIWKFWVRANEDYKDEPFEGRKPKDVRILCWPNVDNEMARPLYEDQGYSVKHYKEKVLSGAHRFYLNEKRYCLFLRSSEDRFFGFIGNDNDVISKMRDHFLNEWGEAAILKPADWR